MTTMPPRCFMTFFVSRYDNLVAAKHHYQRRIDMVRQRYQVVFAPEQAYGDGNDSALFDRLVHRTTAYAVPEDERSLFVFSVIILLPDAAVEEVAGLLDADPGEFVSHTEVIRMSPPGAMSSPRSAGRHRKTAGPFVVKHDNQTCG